MAPRKQRTNFKFEHIFLERVRFCHSLQGIGAENCPGCWQQQQGSSVDHSIQHGMIAHGQVRPRGIYASPRRVVKIGCTPIESQVLLRHAYDMWRRYARYAAIHTNARLSDGCLTSTSCSQRGSACACTMGHPSNRRRAWDRASPLRSEGAPMRGRFDSAEGHTMRADWIPPAVSRTLEVQARETCHEAGGDLRGSKHKQRCRQAAHKAHRAYEVGREPVNLHERKSSSRSNLNGSLRSRSLNPNESSRFQVRGDVVQ